MKLHTQIKISASYFFLLALLLATLLGCKKEKVNPVSFADDINTSVRAKVQEPLELKPQMTGTATAYEWLEEGKVVGNQSSYIFCNHRW